MHNILIYGFPVLLLIFEWGLRSVIAVDTWGFTGPSLAVAGLSFLVPLTKPKEIDVSAPEHAGAVGVSRKDLDFIAVTWLLVLSFLFFWAWSCYASLKHPDQQFLHVSLHFAIGLATYAVSLVMTYVKELV
jgi:hypothetical protein